MQQQILSDGVSMPTLQSVLFGQDPNIMKLAAQVVY